MIFWLIAGAMTVIVIAALLAPLLRRPPEAAARGDYDLSVYRDQLAELERDLARGVLTEDQVSAARLEVERRMLAAAERETATGAAKGKARTSAWPLAAVVAIAVPVGAFGITNRPDELFHLVMDALERN